ncbi:MAG: 4Fe-4S binding protein, partial [Candidatus Omnitrophica bacterium]|nr:4Fe-4S binding protein [Candidatus Omnitrophota bacterium]
SIFNIPVLKKRRLRIPFAWGMVSRVILFVMFLLGLSVFADYFNGRSLFHHVNYFNIFNPSRLTTAALYILPLLLVLSFFIFRPFCHWVCPFGLLSWILEKISLGRIRVDRKLCIDCKLCVKACPTYAMRGILDNQKKIFQADCWSCGKCVSSCPKDAIVFK